MRIVHILAGLDPTSGVANMARRFVRMQRECGDEPMLLAPSVKWNPIFFDFIFAWRVWREVRRADAVWVHCSWTFPVWFGSFVAKRCGKMLVVVPSGSFDPKRLNNRARWKKRFAAPLDRRVLRAADEVHALCPAEVDWIADFEPKAKVKFVQVPLFLGEFKKGNVRRNGKDGDERRILFLGRAEDPLKGVKFLTQAVDTLNFNAPNSHSLRIVSDHIGEQLERDWEWGDVLCLPTLSENFGLVVAEAIERGKPVVTTDGATVWRDYFKAHPECGCYLEGYCAASDSQKVELLVSALKSKDLWL